MCGVVGIIGTHEAAKETFLGLTTLQHRGQDAAGILTYDSEGFHQVKNLGLVESVFTRANMEALTGQMALGHARYSTAGRGDVGDVQPFLLSYPFGLGMVHNGNVMNCGELARELKMKGRRQLLTHSDTEVLLHLMAEGLAKESADHGSDLKFDQLAEGLRPLFEKVNGSYSIVTLIADFGLVAFRDPYGLRPLVIGKKKMEPTLVNGRLVDRDAYMIASESVALNFNGYDFVRDVAPGELVAIDIHGNLNGRVVSKKPTRHCMFEWVYFASPESQIDGLPVYRARINLGKELAIRVKKIMHERGFVPDLVVPVPETARIASIALAEELGIPYREVLIKNRYIKRTFILDSDDKRRTAVNLKLSPVRSEIEGKRLLLVDDSIVRGTTSRKLIELVRRAGAKEVYFISTCPPIQNPCYYGIDFPNGKELVAHGRDFEAIEKELGADAVIYLDIPGLKRAVGNDICLACLDGKYPTDVTNAEGFTSSRMQDREVQKRRAIEEVL